MERYLSRAQILLDEADHERRVVLRVALPQPAGLVREPVGPLQARALHPVHSLWYQPGVEVERGADADQDRCVEAVAERRHPLLLLGHADADPYDVGLRLVDLLDDRALLL